MYELFVAFKVTSEPRGELYTNSALGRYPSTLSTEGVRMKSNTLIQMIRMRTLAAVTLILLKRFERCIIVSSRIPYLPSCDARETLNCFYLLLYCRSIHSLVSVRVSLEPRTEFGIGALNPDEACLCPFGDKSTCILPGLIWI